MAFLRLTCALGEKQMLAASLANLMAGFHNVIDYDSQHFTGIVM